MHVFWHRLWCSFCLMLGNQDSLIRYLLPIINFMKPNYLPGSFGAKVLSAEIKTQDVLHLHLKVSKRWPGFIAGQHISLTFNRKGRWLSRTFSLCSSTALWQTHRQVKLCCKIHKDGAFTPLLATLKTADRLNISVASGDFVWQKIPQSTTFIAAGSGITPIAAMLLSQDHWSSPVTLIYRVKDASNAALLGELQTLAAQQPLFSINLSQSQTESAADFASKVASLALTQQYYICGPALFMQAIHHALIKTGVSKDSIHQEQFGLPAPSLSSDDITKIQATFVQAGVAKNILMAKGLSLLQGAEQGGLQASFGCRMGVCFQCVCQKVSGQVRDIRSGVLSGHGEEQIQLCISQPVSELVIQL
jgi:ferredoxin-NADP reductase